MALYADPLARFDPFSEEKLSWSIGGYNREDTCETLERILRNDLVGTWSVGKH